MEPNEYMCAHCKKIFTKGWSDEEAEQEKIDNGFDNTECDIVCDDCYNKIIAWVEKE